jgi:hypothetical protein
MCSGTHSQLHAREFNDVLSLSDVFVVCGLVQFGWRESKLVFSSEVEMIMWCEKAVSLLSLSLLCSSVRLVVSSEQ